MEGKREDDVYEFEMIHRGAKCSCSCPCNQNNPIDVTVVFQAEREKKMLTVTPSQFKKLS